MDWEGFVFWGGGPWGGVSIWDPKPEIWDVGFKSVGLVGPGGVGGAHEVWGRRAISLGTVQDT